MDSDDDLAWSEWEDLGRNKEMPVPSAIDSQDRDYEPECRRRLPNSSMRPKILPDWSSLRGLFLIWKRLPSC
jgi:hypothetical protein